jgi:uncharacterized LabA/DUF88 family protein
MDPKKKTAIVYIDGLNLYKQKLVHHPDLKWLNVLKLCELMLPSHEIVKVRYFTSKVKPGALDTESPKRQEEYWRALMTLGDRISMHFGQMLSSSRLYPAVPQRIDGDGNLVLLKVKKTEEKGTDVSLASYMVLDAAKNPADLHVLLSSDSDFEPTLQILKKELDVQFGLFSPIEKPSTSLLNSGPVLVKIVRRSFLENSQFSIELEDKTGPIVKPIEWVKKQDPLTK